MSGELVLFPRLAGGVSAELARETAKRILGLSLEERSTLAGELHLDEPETFLALCQMLDEQMDHTPLKTRDDAQWIYEYLHRESPGSFLFDEREYYLGELALLAGTAARILAEYDQARTWLDRSEAWFLLTVNASGDIARIALQRLSVRVEQREFGEVIALSLPLREAFLRSGSREHALKCRYLEAACLKETDRLAESLERFTAVVEEAKALGSSKILSPALVSVIQIHSYLGETDRALALAAEAAPILRESKNRVALAKLHWGLAMLLRQTSRLAESVEAFRMAQQEFREIGLRADVAAIHLIIADLLLETGQERQAEWEIRAALPILAELKMVPEGIAAMALLRESLRRRSIDRQALRNLHGYFEDLA